MSCGPVLLCECFFFCTSSTDFINWGDHLLNVQTPVLISISIICRRLDGSREAIPYEYHFCVWWQNIADHSRQFARRFHCVDYLAGLCLYRLIDGDSMGYVCWVLGEILRTEWAIISTWANGEKGLQPCGPKTYVFFPVIYIIWTFVLFFIAGAFFFAHIHTHTHTHLVRYIFGLLLVVVSATKIR